MNTLVLSAKGNNERFTKLPENLNNIYVLFSSLNYTISNKYARFIEIVLKNKLKKAFLNLISKIKKTGIVSVHRMDIISFQHKLYIQVALQLLNHYYQVYNNEKKQGSYTGNFLNYIRSIAKSKKLLLIDFIDDVLFATENLNLWENNLNNMFDKKMKELSEKMDIQMFIFISNSTIPLWELNFETSVNISDKLLLVEQGGLYNIDIKPINTMKLKDGVVSLKELIDLKPRNTSKREVNMAINRYREHYTDWYDDYFNNSLAPTKDELFNIILGEKSEYYKIKDDRITSTSVKMINLIEKLYVNNIVLLFFYSNKPKTKLELQHNEDKIYTEQGMMINKNTIDNSYYVKAITNIENNKKNPNSELYKNKYLSYKMKYLKLRRSLGMNFIQ